MNKIPIVDVSNNGAVLLGPDVICDGFLLGPKLRVQSHIHIDHMSGFDDSKAEHNIFLSKGAYDLLVNEKGFDIPCRSNIQPLDEQAPVKFMDVGLRLLNSGHMLGAVQIEIETKNCRKVGYSGDFQWPLDHVIEVEELVVDCTNGSPNKIYGYTQEDVESRFVETMSKFYLQGSVALIAHRGTLQRAMDLLDRDGRYTIVATEKTVSETKIYEQYGYSVPKIFTDKSDEGRQTIQREKHVRVIRQGERRPSSISNMPTIVLSAYMSDPNEPLLKFAEKSFRIAMTDHADFEGILEYISATGAKIVITDNSRGGNAGTLANEITARLGIYSRPSSDFNGKL